MAGAEVGRFHQRQALVKAYTTICRLPSRGLRMNLRVRRVTSAMFATEVLCLTVEWVDLVVRDS